MKSIVSLTLILTLSLLLLTVSQYVQASIFSPLKQLQSGIKAENVQCKQGFVLILKNEDGSPACIKPEYVEKLIERGWAKHASYYVHHVTPKVTAYDYFYGGMDKNNTIVSIYNQTYYQTTLNFNVDNLKKDMSIQFHNVTFTFPEGILISSGGNMMILDIQFPDRSEEIYGDDMVNSDKSGTGIEIPSQFGPPARTSITILSNHIVPQAGLTLFHDKIKLLVSTENNTHVDH